VIIVWILFFLVKDKDQDTKVKFFVKKKKKIFHEDWDVIKDKKYIILKRYKG
jgi:hypothetical protein